jgi:hypothetical protein
MHAEKTAFWLSVVSAIKQQKLNTHEKIIYRGVCFSSYRN